jgi:hypothetical protein
MSGARLYFMLFVAMSAAHQAPPKFEPLPSASMQASPPPAPVMTPTPAPQSHEIMLAATAEAVPDALARRERPPAGFSGEQHGPLMRVSSGITSRFRQGPLRVR